MNFKNLFVGALAVIALSACSNKDSGPSAGAVAAPAEIADGDAAPLDNSGTDYAAGTPAHTFTIESGMLLVDGVAIDQIDDSTFAGYANLAAHVAMVSGASRVVETTDRHLELWNDAGMILAIDLNQDAPRVVYSNGAFEATGINYSSSDSTGEQGQEFTHAVLTVDMRECLVDQQDQDQDQDQEKGEDKVEDQDQGKGEEQEKVETCRTAQITWNLIEVRDSVKEQDQGKGEEQDQGKGAPVEPQDQGKGAPVEPQDQGKGAPVEPQDQGKGAPVEPQDEGKGAPVEPQDQGKDSPNEEQQK